MHLQQQQQQRPEQQQQEPIDTRPAHSFHQQLVERNFPPIDYGFAYGSGVFIQPDLYLANASSGPMLDYIFVVADPLAWHAQVAMQ